MSTHASARTHFRACNLCEAICGLEITLDKNDEILAIRGDSQDPLSRGHICPKAVALKDVYADENRLKSPVRRTSNGWEKIGWTEAFDEIACRIKEIQSKYGADAVGTYTGNPSVHNSGTLLTRPNFLRALRTRSNFTATSVDQLPHHFAAWSMFGHPFLLPVPDIDRTHLMLILGANPLASNGSMMTAPKVANRLREIQKRGGKLVVIDPRKTETAKIADEHFFIKPATDVYLLLALVNVLLSENLTNVRADLVDVGDIQRLRKLVCNFTPEKIENITGISAAAVRRLVAELSTSKTGVIYGRIGVSIQKFGTLCQWLINVLNILTGNFDRAGGAMFTTPAFDILGRAKKGANIFNRWQTKVRGLPEFDGELPVAALAEEIEAENIKGFFTIAGNPVLSTPNGRQLEKAFEKLDFYVAVDIYLNETTRFADIILPPTTGLEVAHYDIAFHQLAVRNTARLSVPLFEKSAEQRHDWEIFEELANRLNVEEGANLPAPRNPLEKLQFGIKMGTYGANGLTLEKLLENPHGIDLGALSPCLPERLLTADGLINLLPDLLVADLERVTKDFEERQNQARNTTEKVVDENFDLLLIGRRHLRDNNSWMHGAERLTKGPNRCTLLIHPATAASKNLIDKSIVRVVSRVGEIKITCEFTDEIAPGVVSIPHGYGHRRTDFTASFRLDNDGGASVNDLTDQFLLDELTGNAALNGVPVRISI
jgi:anaerobic selenocysteine-containing dehydrogenase